MVKILSKLATMYLQKKYKFDGLMLGPDAAILAEAAGCEAAYRETDPPAIVGHALENLDDVDKLLSCFLVGPDKLHLLLGNGDRINTENRPYLEFDTPKQGYGEQPLVNNLKTLLSYRSDIFAIIKESSISEQDRQRLQKFVNAVPDVINGIRAYRLLELQKAAQYWLNAKKLCPEDRAVAALLEFYELRKRIDVFPFEKWSKLELGKVLFVQKRYEEAIVWFKNIVQDYNSSPPSAFTQNDYETLRDAYSYLAQCYNALGKDRKARDFLNKAKKIESLLHR